jgi:hypothetical protein
VLLTLLSISRPKGRNNVSAALSENTGSGPVPELSRVFDLLPVAKYQRRCGVPERPSIKPEQCTVTKLGGRYAVGLRISAGRT